MEFMYVFVKPVKSHAFGVIITHFFHTMLSRMQNRYSNIFHAFY